MNDFISMLPYVKDIGLPIIALYYIFRMYISRVERTDKILEKYAETVADHSTKCTELAVEVRNIAENIERLIRKEISK